MVCAWSCRLIAGVKYVKLGRFIILHVLLLYHHECSVCIHIRNKQNETERAIKEQTSMNIDNRVVN